jgi:hypothetical protein
MDKPATTIISKPTGALATAIPSEVSRRGLSFQQAQKTLEDLAAACVAPETTDDTLNALANCLQEAGYRHEMTDVLAKALGAANAHPQVGALWIRRLVSSKGWDRKYPKYIDELQHRGEIGRRAVLEFLRYLSNKSRPRLAAQTLRKNRSWLKKDEVAWALMAGALAKAGLHRKAVRWTAGCETRENVPVSVLQARALALRGLKRERQARRVVDLALQRPEASRDFPLLLLWNAMEEALSGNTSAAGNLFRQIQPAGWDDEATCQYYLTRGVIRVQETAREDRAEAFYSGFARVHDRLGRRRIHRRSLMLRRSYRRCVGRMARDAGMWVRAMVVPWHSADTKRMILALLLVPGLQIFLPVYLYRFFTKR